MKRRPSPSAANDLALAVHELLRRVRFEDVDVVCANGISRTECHALEVIALDGTISVNDVAARLALNKSTASRVVASLSEKRLIRSEPAADDGRRLVLTVTQKGRMLWESIVESTAQSYRDILADCSPAERKAIIRVVQRIARARECTTCEP